MSAIVIKNVSKSYGKNEVLCNINLTVQPGQIYGMIGPSGSGKTTLVKLIVGMDQPTHGQVKVLDTNVPSLEILQRIGYMAQADTLYA